MTAGKGYTAAVRRFAYPLLVLAATLSTGCFSSEIVVRVKADGTGTIEQTNLANKQMITTAAGMAKRAVTDAGADASQAPNLDNLGDLFDEAKIKEQASSFGLGVRYVSSEPLSKDGLTGVHATYAFDDVRLLAMNNGGQASAVPMPKLRFELERSPDGASTLRMRLPNSPRPPDDPAATPPPAAAARPDLPPEALAMVRSLFKGAHVTIAVEVDGAIVTTDAPRREGSRVTVIGIDVEQLLSDPTKLSALQGMKPGADFTTIQRALDGVPGVLMPATPTVTIEFR